MRAKVYLGILGAIVVLAVAGYFVASQMLSVPAYENFVKIMDDMLDHDHWQDGGYSFNPLSGTLTVENLLMGRNVRQSEGQAPADEQIKINSVQISHGLTFADFDRLTGLDDWRSKDKMVLAKELILNGVSIPGVLLPSDHRLEYKDLTVAKISAADLVLNDSKEDNYEGWRSFLAAFDLGAFALEGVKLNFIDLDSGLPQEASLGQFETKDLNFDKANLPQEINTFLEQNVGELSLFFAGKIASFTLKDLLLKGDDFSLKLDKIDINDLWGSFKSEKFSLTGLDFNFVNKDLNENFFLKLGSFEINGFDASARLMSYLQLYFNDEGYSEEVMLGGLAGFNTLADIFVYPMDLKSASMKNFETNYNDIFNIKIKESSFAGPVKAGQLAKEQAMNISGLEINLPTTEAQVADNDDLMELYEFGRDFGQTSFLVDVASNSSFNESQRLFNGNMTIKVKDLLDLTGKMEIGNLDQKRVDALGQVPQAYLYMMLDSLDGAFGDLSLNEITINIKAEKLLDRIYAYVAKTEANGMFDAAGVQAMAEMGVSMSLAAVADKIEDTKAVITPINTFLGKRGDLTLTIKPMPPLSYPNLQSMTDDATFFNSLNITLQNNSEAPHSIKVKPGAIF